MSSKIIAGTTSGTALNMSADTSGQLEIQTGATPTTAITIDSSQNVGIGTTPVSNTESRLFVAGDITRVGGIGGFNFNTYYDSAQARWEYAGAGTAATWVDSGSGNYAFRSTGSTTGSAGDVASLVERMRLDASGRLLLGCTSTPSTTVGGVLVGNQSSAEGFISSTGTYTGGSDRCLFINGNGTVGKISVSGSITTYATSSDYRLKEDISPMANALEKVAKLKPVTYNWKADGTHGEGFIAHELQEVVPDAVIGEKDAVNEDGTIKAQSIDTSFLIATLTAAIQELKAELDATKAEVQALKAK
jgi:hypothetical protein